MIIQTLLEREELLGQEDLDAISHTLLTECSEFLSNPTPLFRGTRYDGFFKKAAIRTDRRSLSNRNIGTILFNQAVENHLGVANVRNRCHFVSNSATDTRKYGDTYMVFPVNGSMSLSNPDVDDSINTIGSIWYIVTNNLRPLLQGNDIELAQEAIAILDSPGGTIDAFYNLLDRLSPACAKQMEQDWERAQQVVTNGYSVSAANNIPKYGESVVEYMIFNAPYTYLIHLDTAAKLLGTYDHGSSVDTYTAMLANIKSL